MLARLTYNKSMTKGLNYIHIKDYDLPYLEYGEGPRALIFVPGLSYIMIPAQVERRAEFSKTYAQEFTCYYPDRRPNLEPGATTEDMAQDLIDFIDALGLDEVYIAGFSQGGMIAQWAAIKWPARVRALVLTVTLSRPNECIKETGKWFDLLKNESPEVALKYMQDKSFSDEWLEAHKNIPVVAPAPELCRDLDQYEILELACQTHNAYDRLSEIKCPTLVVGGWCDCVVSGQASIEISEALHCDTIMYSKLGHGLYEEANDYHARVFAWLKEQIKD